jgi:hypothetical protein
VYDEIVRRYAALPGGPLEGLAVAMSWSVVTAGDGAEVAVDVIMRRLGADPRDAAERDLHAGYHLTGDCLWFVEPGGAAVARLEVNGFQASRSAVLRRLSGGRGEVHSAFWNVNGDNAFSYAANGVVVTRFEGDIADERDGTEPHALEAQRAPLWAVAHEDGSWPAADETTVMRGIAALRHGIGLDDTARQQIFAVRDRLAYRGPVDDRMDTDPAWRLSQVGWALSTGLCPPPWHDASSVEAVAHAKNAFGDRWPQVAAQLLPRC